MTRRMRDATFAIEITCVGCHTRLDSVTNAEDTKMPEAGDFTICVACGALMVFTSNLGVAPAQLMDIPVLYRAHFSRVIYLIKELKRKNQDSKN